MYIFTCSWTSITNHWKHWLWWINELYWLYINDFNSENDFKIQPKNVDITFDLKQKDSINLEKLDLMDQIGKENIFKIYKTVSISNRMINSDKISHIRNWEL